MAAGAAIAYAINVFLDQDSLRNEVRRHHSDAFKLLIEEKKNNAVKVGIFDEYDEEIESGVEVSSSQGVSNKLYVGQVIYV